MELAFILGGAAAIAVVIAVTVFVARSRARNGRLRLEREQQAAGALAELERTAGSALVRTDERVRLADDELGFAIADFGDAAATDFAPALQRARQRLSEAFHLNQLLNDHIIDAPEQRREWSERIITLCQSADAALDEQHNALSTRRDDARRAPSELERIRSGVARVRESIPLARMTIERLSARYSDAALSPVSSNPDQAEQLLDFALRSAELAASRLAAGRDSEASTAVRAGTETVQRAEALLSAVEGFEVEALQAESTLTAMVAESRDEIAYARSLPAAERRQRIDAAIDDLERVIAELPGSGARLDPVGALSAVRRSNTALDDAVAERAEQASRAERQRAQLMTAVQDAERQVTAARELMSDYRAPIGPDARTRLSEAERELASLTDERDPAAALARARRAAALASDAAAYAHADIANAQREYEQRAYQQRGGGYGGYGGYGVGGIGSNVVGGLIGGLAIGGLLDGLGDVGDFFD